ADLAQSQVVANAPAPAPAGAPRSEPAIAEYKALNTRKLGEGDVARFGRRVDLGGADGTDGLPTDREADEARMAAKGYVRPRAGAGGGRGMEGPPRERFVETAYWNPSVVTDKEGKARVKLRAPMALSSYVFNARGVTGADTLAGQATTELTVRKDFF